MERVTATAGRGLLSENAHIEVQHKSQKGFANESFISLIEIVQGLIVP